MHRDITGPSTFAAHVMNLPSVATTKAEKMTAAVMVRWRRGQSDIKANDGATRTAI